MGLCPIRVVLGLLVSVVAVSLPFFAQFVSFIGAFCSCFVSIVFPAAAYLSMFKHQLGYGSILLHSGIVFFGAVACVWGTIAVFL